ncbi:NFX1-type zinc finger-containing protein 1-like isoform X1 [Crassostrea virginica]
MARRKRRLQFHNPSPYNPKRRRERSPFNYRGYIEEITICRHIDTDSSVDLHDEAVSYRYFPVINDQSRTRTSELSKIEDTLESSKRLDPSTIEWIIDSLAEALDGDDVNVCSVLEKHNFLGRPDVYGMVLDTLTLDFPDMKGWIENLVTLVLVLSKKETIKVRHIKKILGPLSQIKCFKDPSIKNQIENAVEMLEKRERYEKFQEDSHSQIKVTASVRRMLHDLITCEIFPTAEMVVKDEHFPLFPRSLRKPNKSPAHYLIEQFSLFLEDFIGPMRVGIKHYIEYVRSEEKGSRFKDDDVRIYKRIRLLDNDCIAGSGICLQVQFDTSTMKKIRWENCNFLQYGNLVCLTYDDCSELTYALIANRDVKELSNGRIYLEVIEKDQQNISSLRQINESRLVMIESKSFYTAYGHTLKSLQTMAEEMLEKNEDIPFSKYLVHLDNDVLEPVYTRQPTYEMTVANFRCLMKNVKEQQNIDYDKVAILDVTKWPTMLEMGLNEDQYKALQKCLTKKIGILQGPPGTGKTWMGLRIVEFFLCNHDLFKQKERRPILLLSYTNHALDQFFEKLLESKHLTFLFRNKTQPFVRVGGRCTNERVKPFVIKEHRKRTKSWSTNRSEIYNSRDSVKYLDTLLKYLQNGIVSAEFLHSENIIPRIQYDSLSYYRYLDFTLMSNDRIVEWLGILENYNTDTENQTADIQDANVDELYFEENDKRVLDDEDEVNDKAKEIEKQILKLFTLTAKHGLENCSAQCHKKMLSFVRRNLEKRENVMKIQLIRGIRNVWFLNFEDRWRLYRFWIDELTMKLQHRRKNLIDYFNEKNKAVTKERFAEDLDIIKSCYMFGMTTTGAASNMTLLREIQPRIVIVEEAAQVHEQHVIGCLTKHLEHLILIGDHKQLRPTMNNHALKCSHKTDVSLMERLVMNKFPYHCLTKQHRMRPEICRLLTPAIYPSLENHPTVQTYPNVRGMKHNLFFIDHQSPESQSNFSTSYANDFEAKMIARLYKYLILQGYSNSDITILSAYNEQVRKIRNEVSEMSKQLRVANGRCNQRVHITAVDNFQGEENRIILLSLVRSNKECKLGHLGDPQRICVSLSRAREGLFVFGDFDMIYNRNNLLWMKIIEAAKQNEVLGRNLTVVCQKHPETTTTISCPQDFEKVQDGGCDQLCSTQLKCGHVCDKKCHADDTIHDLGCEKPCLKRCENGHPCREKCHKDCRPCTTKMEKTFSTCEHKIQIPCCEFYDFRPCQSECNRELGCGHPCTLKCSQDCNTVPCRKIINVKHPQCGHMTTVECCSKNDFRCTEQCSKVLKCGHTCTLKCFQDCDILCCQEMINVNHPQCGHAALVKCFEKNDFQCIQKCSKILKCGHACTLKCWQDCKIVSCQAMQNVKNPRCGHETLVKCCDKNKFQCKKKCSKLLKCGHTCKGNCQMCSNGRLHIPCREVCNRKLVCGHRCSYYCSNPCPPCDDICTRGCLHMKFEPCGHLCRKPCEPCQELCGWNCDKRCNNKYHCSRECSEICDRPPCDKRCDKSLKCKTSHRCIGLCGEKCPNICKRCNKSKVLALLNGTKNIDEALFVELVDCEHIFEKDFMDEYMGLHTRNESSEDKRLLLKSCPTCSTPIRRSGRYKNIIIAMERDLMEVNRKCEKFLFFKNDLCRFRITDLIHVCQASRIFSPRTIRQLFCIGNKDVKSILDEFLNKAYPRMEEISRTKIRSTVREMKGTFCVIAKWILLHSKISFTEDELEKLLDEVERSLINADLIIMKNELKSELSSEDMQQIDFQIQKVRCPDGETFCREDLASAQSLIDAIHRSSSTSCLDTLDKQRRLSLLDVQCGKHGNWFKCKKGHIYLSEVGGTVDVPRCPDCLSTSDDPETSPVDEMNDVGRTLTPAPIDEEVKDVRCTEMDLSGDDVDMTAVDTNSPT